MATLLTLLELTQGPSTLAHTFRLLTDPPQPISAANHYYYRIFPGSCTTAQPLIVSSVRTITHDGIELWIQPIYGRAFILQVQPPQLAAHWTEPRLVPTETLAILKWPLTRAPLETTSYEERPHRPGTGSPYTDVTAAPTLSSNSQEHAPTWTLTSAAATIGLDDHLRIALTDQPTTPVAAVVHNWHAFDTGYTTVILRCSPPDTPTRSPYIAHLRLTRAQTRLTTTERTALHDLDLYLNPDDDNHHVPQE